MNGLTAPIVAENVLSAQGHKDIVVVAGAADTLDAVDIDTGKSSLAQKICRGGDAETIFPLVMP